MLLSATFFFEHIDVHNVHLSLITYLPHAGSTPNHLDWNLAPSFTLKYEVVIVCVLATLMRQNGRMPNKTVENTIK